MFGNAEPLLYTLIGTILDYVPYYIILCIVPFRKNIKNKKVMNFSFAVLTLCAYGAALVIESLGYWEDFMWLWYVHFFAFILFSFVICAFTIKAQLVKLIYVFFVIMTYDCIVTSTASYVDANLFPEYFSSGYYTAPYLLIYFAVLLVSTPFMWLFLRRYIKFAIGYKTPAWNYMWLIPCLLYILNYVYNESYAYDLVVSTDYLVITLIVASVSFLIYYVSIKMVVQTEKSAALEQIARTRAEMVDILSHEVRTPLTVMSTYAQLAVKKIRTGNVDEQTLADLVTISDEAKRLSVMASNTLRLSRLAGVQDDSAEGETGLVDIGAVAAQLVGLFEPTASRVNRKLTAIIAENLPPIWGDSDTLIRLLWNLLDNAFTHSEYGDIEVRTETTGDTIRIIVKDEGAGIPPELLPKVFERGVSGKKDGSGLGLAFCREITERHRGDISVESEYGKSTTVTVTLPTHKKEAKKDE